MSVQGNYNNNTFILLASIFPKGETAAKQVHAIIEKVSATLSLLSIKSRYSRLFKGSILCQQVDKVERCEWGGILGC